MTEQPSAENPAMDGTPEPPPAPSAPAATVTPGAEDLVAADVQQGTQALLKLGTTHPDVARALARLVEAVATEATRTTRFARALDRALSPPSPAAHDRTADRRQRAGRRARGLFDPFAVFAESGEEALRARLAALDLEQLRDIVAEHGMDHDRLAMKWKDPQRVLDRIVERVEARSSKGSAFRTSTAGGTPVPDQEPGNGHTGT